MSSDDGRITVVGRPRGAAAASARLSEALSLADAEDLADVNAGAAGRAPSQLLIGRSPTRYFVWVLSAIFFADLELAVRLLPAHQVDPLIRRLCSALAVGQATESVSRCAAIAIKCHSNATSGRPA